MAPVAATSECYFCCNSTSTVTVTIIQPRCCHPTENSSRTKFSIFHQAPKPHITSKSVPPFSSLDWYTTVRVRITALSISSSSKASPSSSKTWSFLTLKRQDLSIACALFHGSAMSGFGVGSSIHFRAFGTVCFRQVCSMNYGWT